MMMDGIGYYYHSVYNTITINITNNQMDVSMELIGMAEPVINKIIFPKAPTTFNFSREESNDSLRFCYT